MSRKHPKTALDLLKSSVPVQIATESRHRMSRNKPSKAAAVSANVGFAWYAGFDAILCAREITLAVTDGIQTCPELSLPPLEGDQRYAMPKLHA